jgi:oxalate decarboxylase
VNDDASRFGSPRIPGELDNAAPHLFRLGELSPTMFDGGTLRQAHEENFPILRGEEASIVMLTLEPGGIREPHWHPSAWELNIAISGTAKWTLLDPTGHSETLEQGPGDVVFAPQGSLHYFENTGKEDLKVVIIFNASTPEFDDDIGVGATVSRLPPEILSAVFGVPADVFTKFKQIDESMLILRRPES